MNDDALTGSDAVEIKVIVNGRELTRRVSARQHLSDFLREELNITSNHLGCEHGVCGACTVRVDGKVVRGCLTLAAQLDSRRVESVEGLAQDPLFVALQDAFVQRGAAQCSFCTSGMLLTAYELVTAEKHASREEIREFISGNLCRCTGYHAIVDAIATVMKQRG